VSRGSAPEGDQETAKPNRGDRAEGVSSLVRELTGDLRCAQCGYNLKGVSIRDVCPECGLAVRATILAVVDPRAGELRPVVHPRITGTAFVAVPLLALAAVLCLWGVRLSGVLGAILGYRIDAEFIALVSVWLLAASAMCSIVLVRPVERLSLGAKARAFGGFVAFLALTWVHQHVVLHGDAPLVSGSMLAGLDPERSTWRLVSAGLGVIVMLGFRPNALRLAYRSVVLRTGRVDRQPLLALVAALGVSAAGDALALFGDQLIGAGRDIAGWISLVLVAVGSFLFTVGLWGIVVDTWRIRKVLLRPVVGLADIMDEVSDPAGERGAS